ncbi:phytanoyl-CoA dioxygenase family protein [Streptomyces sp. MMS24-I31]|uniref:phytanoyl-CoA dioxygenase family protein n=1 Tax=Streptomyces sp. MMS24-I31 TaxID=3351563 RepID=UPI00389688CA
MSDETVRLYRDQGFVHIPGVLSEEEVKEFRAAALELVEEEGPQIWGADEDEVQVHYVAQAWRKHEALRRLALHPTITALATRLADGPLRLYSTDVLMKKPHGALPTLVHDDETGLPLSGLSRTLSAWVALGDVPVERGCLTFVPGSHLRGPAERQEHMRDFGEFVNIADVWPEYPWRPRVTVPLRAGDVTFHHSRTVHMAGPNDSDEVRVGYGVVYADPEVSYRPGVQDQHMADLEPGQPLPADLFPLVGHP